MFDGPSFNDLTEPAALRLSLDDQLHGRGLASAECVLAAFVPFGLLDYYYAQPERFTSAVRALPDEPAETLAWYFVLGWTQEKIGRLLGIPQTKASQRVRAAERAFAAVLALGGRPTAEHFAAVLKPLGREFLLVKGADHRRRPMLLPMVLAEYSELHSYRAVAERHRLDRVDVRRQIRDVTKLLNSSRDRQAAMLGAWLHLLVTRSSTEGSGYAPRRRRMSRAAESAPEPAQEQQPAPAGEPLPAEPLAAAADPEATSKNWTPPVAEPKSQDLAAAPVC